MDKIIIRELRLQTLIGVAHPERNQAQTLLANLVVYYDFSSIIISDDINDGISYSAIAKSLVSEAEKCNFFTLEALAEHLAKLILCLYPCQKVKLRLEKPNFVRNTARVGVEIRRKRQDFSELN